MKQSEFPKVISAKVSQSQYQLCKLVASELYRHRILQNPTTSDLLRLLVNEMAKKLSVVNTQPKTRL